MTRTDGITFDEFTHAMIRYARESQGELYPGDVYYLRYGAIWRKAYEDGLSPEETVDKDFRFWGLGWP